MLKQAVKAYLVPDNNLHIDKEVFNRVADGDHVAFKELLGKHQPTIYGQAVAYLKDVQKAEDVVQEVFMALWRNRVQLVGLENPEGYLMTIARNKIMDEFRKKVPLNILDVVEEIAVSTEASASLSLERKELWELIAKAVDEMPAQRKRVFEMSKRDGLKYHEIAERLGISRETVKTHMVKALAFIRDFLWDENLLILLVVVFFVW